VMGTGGCWRAVMATGVMILFVTGAGGCGAGGGGPTRTPSMTAARATPPHTPAATANGVATVAAQLTLSPSETAAGANAGLQIVDLVTGIGEEARAGDIVYVTYREMLTDGTLVEETVVDNTPVPARKVLRQGLIVQGLVKGIPGMKVGGKRRLVIPPDLGYGSNGVGSVPPDSTIIFDIDLVEVRHPPGS
jgi:FKBP-type peptidyl-prolyl cis-trans isomerase